MTAPLEFPALKVDLLENGLIDLTDPTETGDGYDRCVQIHPIQLRWVAEQAGLIREVSASDAELLRTLREELAASRGEISQMGRNMLRIHGMIGEAQEALRSADWAHADLSHEMWVVNELATASEVVIENTPCLANASSVTHPLANSYPTVSAPCTNGAVTVHDSCTQRADATPRNATQRQGTPGAATSRHVTQSHDESRVTGADLSAGQTRDRRGCPTGQDRDRATLSEGLSLDLFRRLVRDNAANLKQVAHWGDGVCGALLAILQQELMGLPETQTPMHHSDDLIGIEWALSQKLDKSSQRFLLVVLAYRAQADRVSLTTAEIAEMTGQDRKTVIEGLRGLADLGLISDTSERTGADGKVPVFRLHVEKRTRTENTGQLELRPPENGGKTE